MTPPPDPAVNDLAAAITRGRRVVVDFDPLFPDYDPMVDFLADARLAAARHLQRMPPMYRAARLAGLDPEQRPDALGAWVGQDDVVTLVLAGPVGAGKTYAAAAAANEFLVRELRRTTQLLSRVHVRWHTTAELLDALRPGNPDSETVWERVRDVPLLVLDDLGHSRPTEWAIEQLWKLLDHRTRSGLRQVVTSSATDVQLADRWGEATADRLDVNALHVVVEGRSRRRPITAEELLARTAGGAR